LTAIGCHVHTGPPRQRRWFWHRHHRAEVMVVQTPEATAPAVSPQSE
jgi:hypothetical protein